MCINSIHTFSEFLRLRYPGHLTREYMKKVKYFLNKLYILWPIEEHLNNEISSLYMIKEHK